MWTWVLQVLTCLPDPALAMRADACESNMWLHGVVLGGCRKQIVAQQVWDGCVWLKAVCEHIVACGGVDDVVAKPQQA